MNDDSLFNLDWDIDLTLASNDIKNQNPKLVPSDNGHCTINCGGGTQGSFCC